MISILSTFQAALKSLGTACTIAGAGFYLHRRGFVAQDGTKTMARLSQQVTLPALFFTKIVYCSQDYSTDPCPNVIDNLLDVWMLLLWPIYVVGCGLVVGALAAKISRTPKSQFRTVLATCAFANSTGLPITLLTVIHANFPKTSELGNVDPTLFLSVYLLMYPILQWGIGGWLLAPQEEEKKGAMRHVLNYEEDHEEQTGESAPHKLIRELSFTSFSDLEQQTNPEATPILHRGSDSDYFNGAHSHYPEELILPLTYTISKVAGKVFQPPVIGALLGLGISSITPLRAIFVSLVHRNNSAPLEWFFDGLYAIGQAAVPVNMCILGVYLSKTMQAEKTESALLSKSTTLAIVIGKLVIMPLIGVLSATFLDLFVLNIPDAIDAPFYLVLMIVFITPTANNVMVMVELSGSNIKEGVARVIGCQYAVAPILLSISVAMVVGLARTFDRN